MVQIELLEGSHGLLLGVELMLWVEGTRRIILAQCLEAPAKAPPLSLQRAWKAQGWAVQNGGLANPNP